MSLKLKVIYQIRSFTPNYIIKNRLGTYYFSYKIPVAWQYKTKIIRKSLCTRGFRQAQNLTRRLMAFMDKWNDIAQRLFADESEFKQVWEQYNAREGFSEQASIDIVNPNERMKNYSEGKKNEIYMDRVIEFEEKNNINLQLLEQLKIYNESKQRDGLTYDEVSGQSVPVVTTRKKDDILLTDAIEAYFKKRLKKVSEGSVSKKITNEQAEKFNNPDGFIYSIEKGAGDWFKDEL